MRDWQVDAQSDVRVTTRGSAPNRKFVVEWRNVSFLEDPETRAIFQAIADETGSFDLVFPSNDGIYFMAGGDSLAGIEDWTESELLYADRTPVLRPGLGLHFDPPTS